MLPNWCSFENLKWVLAILAIPITLTILNLQYQAAQTARQAAEARLRLYTEILTKSTEADANLRKSVFDRAFETYLKEGKTVDKRISALELLTLNSNDSVDLSPIFGELSREIQMAAQKANRAILMRRLERLSSKVKDRQIELLARIGDKVDVTFDTKVLSAAANKAFAINRDLSFTDPDDPDKRIQTRRFVVYPLEHDQDNRRVFFSVAFSQPSSKPESISFWADWYNFPLTNFSTSSKSERFALVVRRYEPPYLFLTLIYFPISSSAVKDKPFINDFLSGLTRDVKN